MKLVRSALFIRNEDVPARLTACWARWNRESGTAASPNVPAARTEVALPEAVALDASTSAMAD